MSVMLSFDRDLWEDEDYHEVQRQSNPHWHCKKEVYSSLQPGHVCALYQRLSEMSHTK
jgi:hypothetical protein